MFYLWQQRQNAGQVGSHVAAPQPPALVRPLRLPASQVGMQRESREGRTQSPCDSILAAGDAGTADSLPAEVPEAWTDMAYSTRRLYLGHLLPPKMLICW